MTGSILIALGGNSISPEGEEGNIAQQFHHTENTMRQIVNATRQGGYGRIVITHGNGPQIGNILLRSELAAPAIYPLPLDTCVSDSEGGMGYMIQQVLHNVLHEERADRLVASLLTQTVVALDDPMWLNPTKYIGQFYTEDKAREIMAGRGWQMKQDSNRGWRRVVASPAPIDIIETGAIRALLHSGAIVIAAGGGGIPVARDEKGRLYGVEAVVDKDFASSLLCRLLKIETFVILTGVEKVCLDYGKPAQRAVDKLTAAEAEKHLADGQFPSGSMGPKIKAAIEYVKNGGREVVITTPTLLTDALAGKTGTRIVS